MSVKQFGYEVSERKNDVGGVDAPWVQLAKLYTVAASLPAEDRAPFLDADLMELAFSMPGHLKIRNGERKWVLKQAVKDLLPETILNRKKEGFSIPMKQWLRRELKPMMERLLAPDRLAERGMVSPEETRRLMDAHIAGKANHAHVLFSLMVFERWAEEFAI